MTLPVGWYLGSPIFIRTSLVEAAPARCAASPTPATSRPLPRRRRSCPRARRRRLRPPRPHAVRGHDRQDRRVQRHRRLPFRPRDRVDRRGRARPLPPPARRLLGPQRPRPVRLPVARRGRLRGRRARARQAQGDRRIVRLRPARRGRSGALPERPDLVQAVQPSVRRGDPSTGDRDTPKVGGIQAHFERVLSAGKCHGNVRGQNVARRRHSDSSHG